MDDPCYILTLAKAPAAAAEETASGNGESTPTGQVRVRWDDSNMQNAYANVCNVSSTRKEMTLLFGTNQTWHTGQQEVTV